MSKRLFTARGRAVWRRYENSLPDSARRGILSARDSYILEGKPFWDAFRQGIRAASRADSAGERDAATGLADAHGADSGTRASNSDTRANDGMRDYPTTRPHLAFDYLSGLVRWLSRSDHTLLSYNDLAGPFAHGDESAEFRRWIGQATEHGNKGILLQYDIDARPDIASRLMQTHIDCNAPGNFMIFRQKIFDWKLKREGIIEPDDDYNLDFALFDRFQKTGGIIGYHCNAFDRSGGNVERAIELFHEDVAELRKHVDLKFFSMHGGHVTPDGMCNARLPIGPYLKDLGLTWVHNGHSVYFHANWADGSASNPRYRNESNDPLDFILSANAGQRIRLLFHPQYYNDTSDTRFDFPILQDQRWVRETQEAVEKGGFDGAEYWENRRQEAARSIGEFKRLFEAPADERPVFINGMSRSGTTLLASMFDAHPEGAMAYESYPRYLHVPADDGVLTVEEYIYAYQMLLNYPDNVAFGLLNRSPLKNLMRFAAVSNWTGMTIRQVGELLRAYLTEHHRVPDATEALKIVAASARFKVRAENGAFWGTKCQGNFPDYFALWPKARLIYILRNGLDILASQKTNGSFNPEPEKLGKNWCVQYERFCTFRDKNPDLTTAMVNYERLVADPEKVMRELCEQIGLSYHPQMVRQHELETTLTRNPRGQLSVDRVQQPIDKSAVNRWRSILSREDVDAFLKGCGGPELFDRFELDWKF